MNWRPKPQALALAGLVAAGAALRFATLGDRSFWVDEGSTVRLMQLSFGGMLHRWYHVEDFPPLWDVLAYGWTRLFGTSEVGLRSLPALLGTATIPVAYAVTARLATRRAGLVAAAVVAVSAIDVWFSQDGRPYALVVLAGGLSFWAFAGARELATPRRLLAWAGASTLAVASHYFAVFLVAAEGLWLLAIHRPARRAIIAASALPAAAFVALIPVAISQRSHVYTESYLTSASLISRIEQIPAQYVVAFQPPAQVAVSIAAFLAIPVAGWLVLRRTDARERAGALVAAAVGGATVLAPIALALVGYDYLLTRATASGFVALVAAVSIGLGARRAGLLGAAGLAWLCGFSLAVDVITADHPKFDHDDWRSAARAVGVAPGPRALVVNPSSGVAVLPIYLKDTQRLRAQLARVREIDVIGLPPPTRRIGQQPRPPRPPSPPPPAGFRLVQRRNAPTFTLVRYEADRPAAVSRGALFALKLRAEPPSLLIARDERAAAK